MKSKLVEELEMYDGLAIIHTRHGEDGRLYFACQVGQALFACVPITDQVVEDMKKNRVSPRAVLEGATETYLMDWATDEVMEACALPQASLPHPDFHLYRREEFYP